MYRAKLFYTIHDANLSKSHLENVLSSQFIQIGLNPQPLVLNDDNNNNNNDDDDDDDDDKIQYIIHDGNLSH